MDRRSSLAGSCNGGSKYSPPRSPAAEDAGAKEEADGGELKSLLPRQPGGGTARKSGRGSKRRVQWNDRHGKKLIEVLEFQPSDSSDSDDEFVDTCVCSIM